MFTHMTSWYELLQSEMKANGDDFNAKICTLTDDELRVRFDSSFGGTNGKPFTCWGKNRVYFPLCYDGAEWVGCAPRNPCDTSLEHQGGG